MARIFDRNLFIMLLAIMVGVIIITYFVGDIVNRTRIEKLQSELTTVKIKSENFTSYFLKSTVTLDQAREARSSGNYHFDLAFLWYNSALSETNSTTMELYKARGIDNCTNSMPYYQISYENYLDSKDFFIETQKYTDYEIYKNILQKYVLLTDSGSELCMLRYNASIYLMYLTENLTYDFENNSVGYQTNMTDLLDLFNSTMEQYNQELEEYNEIQKEIDEYEFFEEIR